MTKKQKMKGVALVGATTSLVIGSFLLKNKVKKMKQDGYKNKLSFSLCLNRYLKAAKKDALTVEIIDNVLTELDKVDDLKETNENYELNLNTDKYLELQEYLDSYYEKMASLNHIEKNKEEEDTEVRLRKCLNAQKYLLENL